MIHVGMVAERPIRWVGQVGLVVALAAGGLVGISPIAQPAGAAQSGGEFVAALGNLLDVSAPAGVTEVPVTGVLGIPASGVTAVQVTVLAIWWPTDGQISAWGSSAVSAPPAASGVLPVPAGELATNTAIVAVGGDGRFRLHLDHPGRVRVDLQGYFSVAQGGGGFQPITPKRLVNTSASVAPTPQPGVPVQAVVGSGQTITVQASGGASGVPAGATAVFANVSFPESGSQGVVWLGVPGAQRRIVVTHEETSTSVGVTVPLGATGRFTVENASQPVHVVIDVTGYFVATSDRVGTFTPRSARLAQVTLGPAAMATVQVAGVAGVLHGFVEGGGGTSAVAVNVTVSSSQDRVGLLFAAPYNFAAPETDPWTTVLARDPDAGDARSNLVTLGVGPSSSIKLLNFSSSPVTVTVDLQGFYTEPPPADPRCQANAKDRVTSTYLTAFMGTDLASSVAARRDTAWRDVIRTLWTTVCVTSVTLTSVASRDPAVGAPARWYHSTTATTGSEIDALGSVFRAIHELPPPGPTGFRVVLGGEEDAYPDGHSMHWIDELAGVTTSAQAQAWGRARANRATIVAGDVWTSYPDDRDLIAGWHIAAEPDQLATTRTGATLGVWSPVQLEAFRTYLWWTTAYARVLFPGTRVHVAPTYRPGSDPQTVWKPFLEGLVRDPVSGRALVDDIEVQDRLWSYERADPPGSALSGVGPYFASARQVVDALVSDESVVRLTSDVELFDPANHQATAPVGFVTAAMAHEAPYVDGFTAYSPQVHWVFGSAPSPYFGQPRGEGVAYGYWAQTGHLPTNIPHQPTATITQTGADLTVAIRATDTVPPQPREATGITQVWVYRSLDGGPEQRIAVCFHDIYGRVWGCGGPGNPVPQIPDPDDPVWVLTDAQVPPGSAVTYRIFAINLSGNQSPATTIGPHLVTAVAHAATNVALGRPYHRIQPDTGNAVDPTPGFAFRQDTNGVETTDGTFGTTDPFSTAWQGYDGTSPNPLTTTIDLGTPRPIGLVTIDALHHGDAGISAPDQIDVSTSLDGVTFTPWHTARRPNGLPDPPDRRSLL